MVASRHLLWVALVVSSFVWTASASAVICTGTGSEICYSATEESSPVYTSMYTTAYDNACTETTCGSTVDVVRPYSYCFNNGVHVMDPSTACPDMRTSEELLATMKWECGTGCTYSWFCGSTSQDPDARACSSSAYAGFSTDTPCTSTESSRSRMVECRASESDSSPAAYTTPAFCPPSQPPASGSNMCTHATKCNAGSGFEECSYTCPTCYAGPGTPVGERLCVDENDQQVTDPEELHFCAPDAPTACDNTCRGWFCAPQGTSPSTELPAFAACAAGDDTGFPEGDAPACYDTLPSREVICAAYTVQEGTGTHVASEAKPASECAAAAQPEAEVEGEVCRYWLCLDESSQLGDCSPTLGPCVADEGQDRCFHGHHELQTGCYFHNHTATSGCDPTTEPAGAACTDTDCGFAWWCAVQDGDSGAWGPCADTCSATAGEEVVVETDCRFANGTAALTDDCVDIFGAAPVTVATSACAGSWSCFSDGTAAACQAGDTYDTVCPAPAPDAATGVFLGDACYESTEAVHYSCFNGGEALDAFACPAAQPQTSTPTAACLVDTGCVNAWHARASAADVLAPAAKDDLDVGFDRLCSVSGEPEAVAREVLCVAADGATVVPDAACLPSLKPALERPVDVLCGAWATASSSCVWDGASCTAGHITTTSSCPDGDRMCDPATKPATTIAACTLAANRCQFSCALPEDLLDPWYYFGCSYGANFPEPPVPACYNTTLTRRVFCFDREALIYHDDADCDGEKPSTSTPAFDDAACAYEYRCAVPGTTDFLSASPCYGAAAGYGPCTVACTTATKHRAVGCVNADFNVAADAERCPEELLPATSSECTAAAQLSGLAVDKEVLVAGETAQVSFCYYGVGADAATINMHAYVSLATAEYSYRVGAATLLSGTATIAVPVLPPSETVTLRVSTKDGSLFSEMAMRLESQCDHGLSCSGHGLCQPATSTCQCDTGFSGPTCAITPCDALACVKDNLSTPCSSLAAPACVCKPGFSGSRCEHSDVCSATLACANGGYVRASGVSCAPSCTCSGQWSGTLCDTCGLSCAAGKADKGCSQCVCPRGYAGDDCSCPERYGVVTFAPGFDAGRAVFQGELRADLAMLTGMSLADIGMYRYDRKLIIGLRSCAPDPASVSSFTVTSASASFSVMGSEALSTAWTAIREDMSSSESLLKSGSLKGVSGFEVQSALYDPFCTGPACAADPFPVEEDPAAGSGGDNTGVIVGAVVGSVVGVLALVALGLYARRRTRRSSPRYDAELSEYRHTSIYANAHASPLSSSFADWHGRPEALTTDDVVLAINARGANSPRIGMTSQLPSPKLSAREK